MIETTQTWRIGDCVELMREIPAESVDTIITSPPYWGMFKYGGHSYNYMEDQTRDAVTGRFLHGKHSSPSTEFKKGQHWREPKPYWNEEWLFEEYVIKGKAAKQIAQENGCKPNNIHYFLHKFGIQARTMSEIRANKYWGLIGDQNGMYGRCGKNNPHWMGGITPERQAFYASPEWSDVVKLVWKRDGAKCSRCGVRKTDDIEMHIHHIITFAVKDMRCNPIDLMLMCKKCHNWIHSKKNIEGAFLAQPLEESLR